MILCPINMISCVEIKFTTDYIAHGPNTNTINL